MHTRNKGITLVALVITIIVLLILAGVTISLALTNGGIFNKAQEAGKQTDISEIKEQIRLDILSWKVENKGEEIDEDTLKQMIDPKYGSLKDVILTSLKGNEIDVSDILAQSVKQNETKVDGVVIPQGFYYVGGNKKDGLVISDKEKDNMNNTEQGNQFVWIPVENIEDMAQKIDGTDSKGRDNYQGKLYDFSATGATEMKNYGQGTSSYREPSILTDDNNIEYNNGLFSKETLQEEYNQIVASVIKYKGFYIGRYELSLSHDKKIQESKAL